MTAERKGLSKSTRFEVFKRDAFTCQYCGGKAPDVVLHVDHIRPVADGGENEILNLITSCMSCNLGKSDRLLSDHAMLDKQRAQLEELNERRAQLEMMIEWRDSLHNLESEHIEALQKELGRYGHFIANETGERKMKAWLKKYGLPEIFSAIETSFSQYLQIGDDGKVTSESWNRAFNMVPRIIEMNRRGGLTEELRKVFYVRGILRRRLRYVDERDFMWLTQDAIAAGFDPDEIIAFAKQCRNWLEYEDAMFTWIDKDKP